jgi:putative transposase
MPRKSRIDAPGALQHIIIRGIERKAIFRNDVDRQDFLDRLETLIRETQTACYAWALLTNHVHLLLRTGRSPIAMIMRRLLTGYAVSFNRRHHRHGHLFQNRYKSVLCEEDSYLLQLVAYIHLNPYRARIVESMHALETYPFAGHCALMGKTRIAWQDTEYILALFGKNVSMARKNYADYVSKCAQAGRRPELTGGGLLRSAGGWGNVKAAYREGIRITSDERILGGSDFVEKVLASAGEDYDRRTRLKTSGIDLDVLVDAVSLHLDVRSDELCGSSRLQNICRARALISCLAVQEFGITGAKVARRLNIDRSSVSRAIRRVRNDPEMVRMLKELLCRLHPEGWEG